MITRTGPRAVGRGCARAAAASAAAVALAGALAVGGWLVAPAAAAPPPDDEGAQPGEAPVPALAPVARGIVFHDIDNDGVRDPGEPGLAGVLVSNQADVVETDGEGRWALPADDDTIFFVIKPRGFRPPVDAQNRPRFFYVHKPKGSPRLRFGGVAATGPLPESIDFPLASAPEPDDRFKAIFFGDPQPRDLREVGYIARDVVAGLVGADAAFGVTLGDLVFNDLSLFEPLAGVVGTIGVPWYNVIGNHDIDFDARTRRHANETFERVFGPSWYAYQVGPVHFVALDNVVWDPRRRSYSGGFPKAQLAFVERYLEHVPEEALVVFLMHIPLTGTSNREALFRVIEDRPHTLSVAAHAHFQAHGFFGPEQGWRGEEPHHHIIHGTVCGSWWQGMPDEEGIPHATMRDGAPNGYSVFTFDGADYVMDYRAARRPAEDRMSLHAPSAVKRASAHDKWVYVNVWDGSERTRVHMRLGDGPWVELERRAMWDPQYVKTRAREEDRLPEGYRDLSEPVDSTHLWRGTLPADPPLGTHALEVRVKDHYGRVFFTSHIVRVIE